MDPFSREEEASIILFVLRAPLREEKEKRRTSKVRTVENARRILCKIQNVEINIWLRDSSLRPQYNFCF